MRTALTGVPFRDASLPYVPISSVAVYEQGDREEPLISDYNTTNTNQSSEGQIKRIVYNCKDKGKKFTRILTDDSLSFDSHFESANLHTAYRVYTPLEASLSGIKLKNHTYELYMQTDIHTVGNTQWFYFSINNNLRKGQIINIKIKNFRKSDSMYKRGMKPLIYSTKKKCWTRDCNNISYYMSNDVDTPEFQHVINELRHSAGLKTTSNNNKSSTSDVYYTLNFTHEVLYDNDICYFAYCYPYTYTDLQQYLHTLLTDPRKSPYIQRSVLCKTLGGNVCDLLTITSPATSAEELLGRPVVFLSARIHPGASCTVYMYAYMQCIYVWVCIIICIIHY